MKVILHLNENSRWNTVLGNAYNLLKLDSTIEIEILINGEPLERLKEETAKELNIYNKLKDLSEKGIKFAVCNNTMKKIGIEKKELCSFATVVKAGVMELIEKQNEGYAYIKP